MPVKRTITVSLPIAIPSDHNGVADAMSSIRYEVSDDGRIKVDGYAPKGTYYVLVADLIELVMALGGGTLLKRPDILRKLQEYEEEHIS